jgi:molecular chaperone GrpE (heat shock protein)
MSILSRLDDTWRTLRGRASQRESAMYDELVTLRRKVGHLELELKKAGDKVAIQRSRLDQLEALSPAASANGLEKMFQDLAAATSQLRMQASLMTRGREISGRSVMALANQLIEVLENHGLEPIGVTGEKVAFDPVTCQALSADASFQAGAIVTIKFVGYRYNGRVLRRALVDAIPSE